MKTTTILKQVTLLWAVCFGLCANAQDVHVTGYYNDGTASNMAAIWEGDGTRSDFTNGSTNAYSESVFVYNGDVYAAGYEYNGTAFVATIWKNGTSQRLTSYNGTEQAYANS